jgi:DNA-binding beta-propeller fold protein YncE
MIMKGKISSFPAVALGLSAVLGLINTAQQMPAQTRGYVAGSTLQPFDPASGALVGTALSPNVAGTPAVSKDGSTLYNPEVDNQNATLVALATSNWQPSAQIPGLAGGNAKAILDPTGTYAFVLGASGPGSNAVAVVNLAKSSVVAYIHVVNGEPMDIALSPNGKQLFVSTLSSGDAVDGGVPGGTAPEVQQTVYKCTAVPGICVFNTSPFAVAGKVTAVSGFLAVSQDGNSLYATGEPGQYNSFVLVNTASLAVSRIKITSGYMATAIAVAPSGNRAALLAESATASVFLLDTTTNEITGTLPLPAQSLTPVEVGGNVMAFSPDGTSLWTVVGIPGDPAPQTLVGQSFPSGDVIAQTPLPANTNAFAVVF